ncbi:acyltransferase family protein [Brevundimonas sp.]|uniref:acyltransferase family protein n=1 Tax=Brevundimonas sp. TaxID=1871086 RepID=UPI0025C58419|nr:acyltransferase family protein [Brevundimonas sp.]
MPRLSVAHAHRPYRPEIDGLRAIAVLGVVLYHAFPTLLPGGFVGVDVFFVISGFLITGILVGETDTGWRSSLVHFYDRRVRRILPALIFMVGVVSAIALVAMAPGDLRVFGRSLMSVAAFTSNQFFFQQTDYFSADANDNILLHTWSLGIEEQFYLVWPLAVLVLYRTRLRPWAPVLIAVALLISLAWSQRLLANEAQPAAFYLFRSRGWELLVGALLATGVAPQIGREWVRQAVAVAGLAAILGAMLFIDEGTSFPGLLALLPCLGAAAVIHAGLPDKTLVHRLLAWRGLVGVGLISYSLYLWHWPALVLPRLLLARELSPLEAGVAGLVALAMACFSWRWVERPFRRRGQSVGARQVIIAGLTALILTAGFGAVLWKGQGFPHRASSDVLEAEAAALSLPMLRSSCHMSGATLPPAVPCTYPKGQAPDVVLWGDSHADHLMPLVSAWAQSQGRVVRQISKSACPPLLVQDASFLSEDCPVFNQEVLAELKRKGPPTTLVLSARWTTYMVSSGREPADAARLLGADIAQSVDAVRRAWGPDVEVVLVGPTPDFGLSPSLCYARARFARLDTRHCEMAVARNSSMAELVEANFAALARETPSVRVFLPRAVFCSGPDCRTRDATGRFLFQDDDHLTPTGALNLMPAWDQLLSTSSEPDTRNGETRL